MQNIGQGRDDAARKRLAFVVVLISSNDERASKPCLDEYS
jgi:hypothetical protein